MTRERVVVSGATGLVGRRLVEHLAERGTPVTALTRDLGAGAERVDGRAVLAQWDGTTFPAEALGGARAVVHLAGEPVFGGRLTAARRRKIFDSRIDTTRSLVDALTTLPEAQRPEVLICASAVGFYGNRGDDLLNEDAGPGEGFLAEVCQAWEKEASGADALGVRRASLRIGIVLSRAGGALPLLTLPFRFGLGGRLGDGKQWFPWIHLDDLVRLLVAALDDERYCGAINAVSPNPVRNAELTKAVATTLHRPALLPVPAFAIRAALGGLADELLGSRRVVPSRALEHGFRFETERVEDALEAELAG